MKIVTRAAYYIDIEEAWDEFCAALDGELDFDGGQLGSKDWRLMGEVFKRCVAEINEHLEAIK